MASKESLKEKIKFRKQALASEREAYLALTQGGVASYTIGSRSLTKLDIDKLAAQIRAHENEIDELEAQLTGSGRRKAVGAVRRDW